MLLPKPLYVGEGGWGVLENAGQNGLFLLLVALKWWGSGEGQAATQEWRDVCIDLKNTLARLGPGGTKRVNEDEEDGVGIASKVSKRCEGKSCHIGR